MRNTVKGSISTLCPLKPKGEARALAPVASVAEFLRKLDASLTAVHSVKFGGNYGTHFLFRASPRAIDEIRRACEPEGELHEAFGACYLADDEVDDDSLAFRTMPVYRLLVHGLDRKAVISDLSQEVADLGAVILAMSGSVYSLPASPQTRFVVEFKLGIPNDLGAARLLASIHELANTEGWHVECGSVSASRNRAANTKKLAVNSTGEGSRSARFITRELSLPLIPPIHQSQKGII